MDQRFCRCFYDLNVKITDRASIEIGPVLTLYMNDIVQCPTSLFQIYSHYTTCIIRCQFAGLTLDVITLVFIGKPSDSGNSDYRTSTLKYNKNMHRCPAYRFVINYDINKRIT